ncbi:metallophosphoesterase [Nostoc sp. 106C]|uniref:metallophosphoesterase n=1 Tax=Nostoc sp. 106C TaxID=1932667 RepID=UPI000A38A8A8|nr:metallophosphoesterase [Nostoc sp. 106C]OUL24536.1 hypothetical protein BV378_19345 [Nostoc sp. RF31YmG]OUL30057.1 hypothetical protein BV375_14925 [Nostoc sp. 106C]
MEIRKEGKRKFLALVTTLALALATSKVVLAGNGTPINQGSANVLTLAVYGDSPYGTTPTDNVEFYASPTFIDSINSDPKVDLVLHVGDIHSGKQYCTQAYDQAVFDLWKQFKDPLVYTPGDNEWTDCHKSGEGGGVLDAKGNPVDYANGDPIANLDLIRSIFFSNPGVTLGGRKKQVISQAQVFDPAHPSDAKYVENVIWEQSKVLFVTVNIPGGSNNDNDIWYGKSAQSAAQQQEIQERTDADLRWLDAAFAQAKADGVQAVLIATQANMWDLDGKPSSHLTAYNPFVDKIAKKTQEFGKPVLLFNGDSHEYLSDNPLSLSDPLNYLHPGFDVPNFHRIVVHGSTFPLEWLKLTIDPQANNATDQNAFGPFTWERVQPKI